MRPLTSRGRRRRALATPFPDAWRALLSSSVAHWRMLDGTERARLEDLIRILLADKLWEATDGFALTEEIQLVISALAGLLILGLDYDDYHNVTSIIVGPSTMTTGGDDYVGGGLYSEDPLPILGLSASTGPVLIAWDAARSEARHPEHGHNVVYHEFAHKLDALDGSDGAPPLETEEEHRRWAEVCNAEYAALRGGRGGDLIDAYGATNSAEFFAVITELFFDRPVAMERAKPELYDVLRGYYRQDPAARERRSGALGKA
jgi:Mlc titration factor MtfA (ptsG expression regulator)